MKVFDPGLYRDISIHAYQAEEIAKVSDHVLKQASFVLYGRYQDGQYVAFSSDQKQETPIASWLTYLKN